MSVCTTSFFRNVHQVIIIIVKILEWQIITNSLGADIDGMQLHSLGELPINTT